MSRLALVLTLSLVACATRVHDIPGTYAPGDQPDSVVIGRLVIELAGPGGIKPLSFFEALTHLGLTIRNETTGKSYMIVCDESGTDARFYVALPPGNYALVKVTMNQMEASPSAAFSLPSRRIVYIGALRYTQGGFSESVVSSVLAGNTTIVGDWRVEDRSEEAIAAFRAKFPDLDAQIDVSLIELER